jgi:hypothetical protein
MSLLPTSGEFVGFEVFTAVVLKSIFFWDMTPCSALSCTLLNVLHGVISQKKILFRGICIGVPFS